MFAYPENTPIVIYGNSMAAELAYYRWHLHFDIKGFITPGNEKTIINLPAYPKSQINDIVDMKFKIVVVDDWGDSYILLNKAGNNRLYDVFITQNLFEYEMIDISFLHKICTEETFLKVLPLLMKEKKGVLINGSCQIDPIAKYLSHNERFNKEYIFLKIPPVHLFNDDVKKVMEFEPFYKFISLFISQLVSYNNRFSPLVSTEEITKKLPKDCKKVSINNYFFKGYFPQSKDETRMVFSAWPDKFIDEMIKAGKSIDDTYNALINNEFMTAEEMDDLITAQFEGLRARESTCDIKMVEYMENHFREEILFHSTNHPTNKLLKESAIRILRFLGFYSKYEAVKFENEEYLDKKQMLKICSEPIYPFVLKYLGLESYEKSLSYTTFDCKSLSLYDYVKRYYDFFKN